jgi:hypothetical protein
MNKPAKRITQSDIGAALGIGQSMVSREFARLGILPAADGTYTTADIVALAQDRARPTGKRAPAMSDTVVLDTIRASAQMAVLPFLLTERYPWLFCAVAARRAGVGKLAAAEIYIATIGGCMFACGEASGNADDFKVDMGDGMFAKALAAKQAGALEAWAASEWGGVEELVAEGVA